MEQSELISPTSARLNLYSARPAQAPKAIVHITHGMAEHAARYEWFADVLTQDEFAVYAHDLRGHGHTKSDEASLGLFAPTGGLDKVMADHDFVLDHIAQEFPKIPIFCFGHSLGSVLVFNYAIRYPDKLAGIACWNTGLETGFLPRLGKLILTTESLLRASTKNSLFAWHLTFGAWNAQIKPSRTGFDWLSHDAAQVDAYIADPLCGFDVSAQMWQDIIEAVFYASKPEHLLRLPKTLPIFLLGGAHDPCTNFGKDMQNLQRKLTDLQCQNVRCEVLENTRHESLNEINRAATSRLFVDWVQRSLPCR
ncbi:MAG: alpha/beta hydrolase [Paracoccaceae bacterium]|nr:alpha/beta hydrolase [Paracoccaceae bacterium]